jgi:diadenosine tetraphosphate (Ap4A) HIT family hydrolase
MSDCLACDLTSGEAELPGGLIFETPGWRVEHCVGSLGVGTLIVKPKRHVTVLAELTETEAAEMGPLLWRTAAAVHELAEPAQVNVCLWSRGPVHIHYVVQPELRQGADEITEHGPKLQATMFAAREPLDRDQAAAFAVRAREWFTAHSG